MLTVKAKETENDLGISKDKFYDVMYKHEDKRTMSGEVYVIRNDNEKFVGIDPIHFE